MAWLVGRVRRQSRARVFVSGVLGPTEARPLAAIDRAAGSLQAAGAM